MDEKHVPSNVDLPALARFACQRQRGIGADGLILLCASSVADYKMRIFNADGSEAAMCGNGIRCLVDFIQKHETASSCLKIETQYGVLTCRQSGEDIAVNLGVPKILHWPLELQEREVFVVDTGVPHAVLFVNDLDAMNVAEVGSQVRFSSLFVPHGVNVNFVSLHDEGKIAVRTYERGVEAETLACGTGTAAAAYVTMKKYKFASPIEAMTRLSFQNPIQYHQDLCFQFHTNEQGSIEIEMLGRVVEVFQGFLIAFQFALLSK